MNNAVELNCWACDNPFTAECDPGRLPRYCGPACKNLACKIACRVYFIQHSEDQRALKAEALKRNNELHSLAE